MNHNIFRAILLLILLCGNNVKAQQTEKNDTVYFDTKWHNVPERSGASFYRIPRVLTDTGYRIEDYFINGRLQMLGYATTPDDIIHTGNTYHYDSLGHKTYEGTYRKGMKTGLWKYYYRNSDDIKRIVNYSNDLREGSGELYDSVTHHLIAQLSFHENLKEGKCQWFYPEYPNTLRGIKYFHHDVPDSATSYYPNGMTERIEHYEDGLLLVNQEQCFDSTGKRKECVRDLIPPQPDHKTMDKVFYQEVLFSREESVVLQGTAKFSFTISKEGTLTDRYFEKVGDQPLEKDLNKFLDKMNKWSPAKYKGQEVACKISFKLTFEKSGRIRYQLGYRRINDEQAD